MSDHGRALNKFWQNSYGSFEFFGVRSSFYIVCALYKNDFDPQYIMRQCVLSQS